MLATATVQCPHPHSCGLLVFQLPYFDTSPTASNFLVAKESSSYLSLLLLLWPLFLREQDVVDRYVHLRDPKAGQVLHPVYHVVAHGLADLRDLPAVLNSHREICGGLLRANLDGDAAGLAPTTDAGDGPRHAVSK